MAMNKEDRAAHRYQAQQRRSKKAQAQARRKQKKKDRSENIEKTAALVGHDVGMAMLASAIGGPVGAGAAGIGAAMARPGLKLGAKALQALSRSKAGKALLKKLRQKSPVKITRTKPRPPKSALQRRADWEDMPELVGIHSGPAAAVGATGKLLSENRKHERQLKEQAQETDAALRAIRNEAHEKRQRKRRRKR